MFSCILVAYYGLEQAIEWLIGNILLFFLFIVLIKSGLHTQIRDDKYLIGQFLENVEANEVVAERVLEPQGELREPEAPQPQPIEQF